MRQPQSIRFQLTAVFFGFFLLVVVLGLFSIWRLSNFNALSADVADVWLPDTRVLGDLNNFTSDFRAIEGSNLLSSEPAEIADTEWQMAELDRSIANAERGFEQIRHQPAEERLYEQFKTRWTDYRTIVNRMLALSRTDRKPEALAIYTGASRSAYDVASDTLGRLTDQAVAAAAAASERLGSAYRQAFWLILLAMLLAGLMVVLALIHISRSISAPLLHLAGRMRALAANNTDIDIPETARRDEIGEMAQATTVFRNNAIELMRSQHMLGRQAAMLEEQLAQEQRLALAQRNFISMASHEFRTPLTIIDG
ncbi:MAG: MCP four helix bundle domain-containing protein, partial [Stellaceae bacterium]